MSSVPHARRSPQGTARHPRAVEVARRLTPLQRQLLVRAGMPRWLRLPCPWEPAPGRHAAAARALSSPELAVLEPVPSHLGAYRLTGLGEQVAGIWLLSALVIP